MQHQPLRLEDLSESQFHHNPPHHQSAVFSSGLILSSHSQRQHHRSVSHQALSHDPAAYVKRQRDEIDQFLLAQEEQLRRALAEKLQKHHSLLLAAAEAAVSRRLREKEAEVEKATRHHAELQARAAQLSVEVQVWRAKARAQEAAATSLQAQLQQRQDKMSPDQQPSRCGETEAEDAHSAFVERDRAVATPGPSCRSCQRRAAAAVLLPCRHLCLCNGCDRMARACPVCFAARESSVEVYFA
ncbi:hypothetical protein SAY86_011598 [Trapa natans]|uniref:RING-type domain-containing protein n=1 Tax=Trapa natans TaxID=22666 RepID=A0AAN7LVN5_TRANT|nr:hypothetical protein SAY86_011598 [Trapa natans]